MKPDKNKSLNKKDLLVILILVVMVVGVILTFYNSSSKPETWKYNNLIENVENDTIKSITATPVGSWVNSKLYQLEGVYYKLVNNEDKEAKFTIVVDDTVMDYFHDEIRVNKATFTI